MEANIDVSEEPPAGGVKTRIFALVTLLTVVSGVGYVGREGYRAATDSFIAPIILSPDNDLIVQSKIKLNELYVERAKAAAELEGIESNLAACEKAIVRLKQLQTRTENALVWTKKVNAGQAFAGTADLHTLAEQKSLLATALAQQDAFSRAARADLDAGLISRTDYAKEVQSVGQVQLGLLENERMRLQAEMQMKQVMLAQQSLASGGGAAPMPEMINREDQMVRVELELLKLEAEQRTQTAERTLLRDKLAKIDEIGAQLKGRPIFRAVEKSMDVAFVPYTQIEGMHAGEVVYDCVWGLFHCKAVGSIAEIVPGEVILPDPWGTQTRGQYAVLDLSRHESAKSKSLRVRLEKGPQATYATMPVAAK